MSASDYVVVDRLAKTFNPGTRQQVEAVSATSFSVKSGEFVSLLGPSGCGKSTLLMMIAGLDTPSQGAISVAGRAMKSPRAETGVMFQDPTLLPWKTAIDNVLFPFEAMGRPVRPNADRAAALLDQVGLTFQVVPEDNLLILTDSPGSADLIDRVLTEIKALHHDVHDLQDAIDEITAALMPDEEAGGARMRKPTIIEEVPGEKKPGEKPEPPPKGATDRPRSRAGA